MPGWSRLWVWWKIWVDGRDPEKDLTANQLYVIWCLCLCTHIFAHIHKHIFVYTRIWRKNYEKYKSCGFCCRDYPLTWNSHHPSNKPLPIRCLVLQTAHARRRVGPWLPQLQFVIICGIRDSGCSFRQLNPHGPSHGRNGIFTYMNGWFKIFMGFHVTVHIPCIRGWAMGTGWWCFKHVFNFYPWLN